MEEMRDIYVMAASEVNGACPSSTVFTVRHVANGHHESAPEASSPRGDADPVEEMNLRLGRVK
jgi:hypothetical protein